MLFAGQIGQTHYLVLAIGVVAIVLLVFGERLLPGKPVALGVVALSIVVASVLGLPALGVPITGNIPAGLPTLEGPALRLRDVEGIVPLAAGCLLLAYIESVSAGRAFAAKHGYHSRPPAGTARYRRGKPRGRVGTWLSRCRRAVAIGRERQGRRTHASRSGLCFDDACAVPAVSHWVAGKPAEGGAGGGGVDRSVRPAGFSGAVAHVAGEPAGFLRRGDRARGACCFLASCRASCSPQLASVLMLLARASQPHVAFLGRIPGTNSYSDLARHPDNEALPGVIAFRPEASLIYVNADAVLESVLNRVNAVDRSAIRLVVCDLSASPYVDLAGSRMLHELHADLAARGVALRIVGAHGWVRDLLRADGMGEKVGGLDRSVVLDQLLSRDAR